MASVETRRFETPTPRQEERSAEIISGGSMAEAVGGLATLILAIVALAGVFPSYLTPIAAIVLGGALLAEGAAVCWRYSQLLSEVSGVRFPQMELGGGLTAELFGGIAGIALGILALLGIHPLVLLPISAIVFGASLLFGTGTMWGLNHMAVERWYGGHEMARNVAGTMVAAASGAQALAGMAAVILGIVGLVGIYPMDLTLVAFLVVGASVTLSGAALSGRMMSMFQHHHA